MIGLESDKKFQANSPRKCTRLTHFSQMSWSFHFVRKVFVRQNLPTGKFWLSGPLRGTPSNINFTIILKPYITDLLWTAPIWQSSIFINFIIIIVVHVYHSEYHPNLLQLQYHSILTSSTIISITLIIINDSGRRTSWQLCALGIKWIFHPLMPTFCPSTSSSSASKSSIVTSPSIHIMA